MVFISATKGERFGLPLFQSTQSATCPAPEHSGQTQEETAQHKTRLGGDHTWEMAAAASISEASKAYMSPHICIALSK